MVVFVLSLSRYGGYPKLYTINSLLDIYDTIYCTIYNLLYTLFFIYMHLSFLVLGQYALAGMSSEHTSRVFSNETLLAGVGMVERQDGISQEPFDSNDILVEIERMEAVYQKKYHVFERSKNP